MPKTMFLIFMLLFSTDACTDRSGQSKALHTSSFAVRPNLGEEESLKNTIGVITLNEKSHSKSRWLQFFNEDGSLWYEFSFYDEDRSFDRANTEFQPFSFHRDYFVLALKCVGKDANRFQVVVNDSTRLTKFIRRRDDSFKFQTWKDHVLDLFAVGFDPANNPLRTGPGENVSTLPVPSEKVTFHPLQINGNWLKVSWNVADNTKRKNKKVKHGWVKWRQNGKLLIYFFYFS